MGRDDDVEEKHPPMTVWINMRAVITPSPAVIGIITGTMALSALTLVCTLGLLGLSSACYIQNCPRGGKRSFLDAVPRQCLACGPADKGQCFGPGICCGEGMGCLVGSPESARCVEEDYLPSPCDSRGKACGSEEGRCAAPGVCCHSDGCVLDPECVEENKQGDDEEMNRSLMGASRGELLLRMLSRARSPY